LTTPLAISMNRERRNGKPMRLIEPPSGFLRQPTIIVAIPDAWRGDKFASINGVVDVPSSCL